MIKKYSKILLMLICCFIGVTSVSAREMTLDELEVELNKIRPDAAYIYVVGEYAFSSNHEFTRQDGILSARSIVVTDVTGKTDKDNIYNEMTIYRYLRVEDDYGDYVGLEYKENMVGTTKHPDKLNIKYIDYVLIPDLSFAEVKIAGTKDYAKLKDKYGITYKNDDKLTQKVVDGNVEELGGDIYYNGTIGTNVFPANKLTGYYYAFTVKVDMAGMKDNGVLTVEGTEKKNYTKADLDVNGELVVLMPLDPNLADADKKITVSIDFDGDGKGYTENTYEIDYSKVNFKKVIDVNSNLKDIIGNNLSDKYVANLNGNTISMEQKDVVSNLADTTGKGLTNIIKEALDKEGIESITLKYNGKEYTVTKANADSEISKLLKDITGKDSDKAIQNDIIGKSIEMTVKLEQGNVTMETPNGKNEVTYTIDFTGKKAKDTLFDVLVDKNNALYSDSKVQTWLNNLKFDMLDADLKLENGKLTGTVLENKKVEFSTNPASLTDYYFTYIIELKENATDKTVVTLPNNGGTKELGKASFDSDNSMVVVFALNKDATNKTFEIVVDLDGDGQDYLPTTYIVDYSEVQFLTPEEMLKLASDNTEETKKIKSTNVTSAEDIDGTKAVITMIGKSDLVNKVVYNTAENNDGEKEYQYLTERNGALWLYTSDDETTWYSLTSPGAFDDDTSTLFDNLFKDYKSVERVDSDKAGMIKLAVTREYGAVEIEGEDGEKIIFNPVKDAIDYVYIKDTKLNTIETDVLDIFDDEVKSQFKYFTQSITIEELNENLKVPDYIINNAIALNK